MSDTLSTMTGFETPDTIYEEPNTTTVAKSLPADPSPDHVEALRLNPQFSGDFDLKFGAGSAAKHLASAGMPAPEEPAKPSVYRPALSWSTADILSANKAENPLASAANSFVDGEIRKLQAARDTAAHSSVEAFMRGPAQKTMPQWLDDEIASAEYSIGFWKNEMSRSDVGGVAYNADYERAHARLEAARKAKADLDDGSDRTAHPEIQIAIATRIADQKGRVAYAEDQLEAAKDGDLGTGLSVKQYEDNLRHERKKLNALETAMDYARQKKAVDGASGNGELGRSFLRSLMAETPEMLAGAVAQISKTFGPEYGVIASEIAGEVKTIARGLKQDMPAPKHSEILALDPRSPEFANNLKLYAAHALGQGLGSTAAFWFAAAVGGPVTAGGMGITLGVGQMRNALEEEFAKEGMRLQDHDVDRIVYGYGTAIGMLDAYGAMFNLNMLGREVKTAAVRHMASAIARGAAKGAAVEGITEGLQEALQIMGENYALERGMDWTKFRDRVIESFAAGTIPGMAFGAKNAHTEQGAARARREYEDILKKIEEDSKLKPGEVAPKTDAAAPTVSSPAETVSAPETERRGGRPLPPVQAEAVDPATVPKPEPVTPQPETLSELSKQEKTDLLETAKEAGIAREGETPEQTLQRMREQRAEGASFGPFDAVFDRLDQVEADAEQQRAKDATIQPEDVETIVDMWRFVEEAGKVKDPEGIIDFLRRSGGVVDFDGDVRATLGEARNRPGLVSNTGLPLDQAARLAWDNGFLMSAERPDINALLDAIAEDHAGNRVVRGTDRAILDDLNVAREMVEELRQLGIKKGMKENDVRDTLKGIAREGGSGAQDRATNTRGPQPSTIQEAFQKDALEAYIERGGGLDVASWGDVAHALGVERKDVASVLDQAAASGLIRKHDGRYWRNPADVFAEDIPFAIAGTPKVSDADIEKHERIQGLVRLAIGEGQSVQVPKEITDRVLSEMRASRDVLPSDAVLAAIERIDPIKNDDGSVVPDSVVLTFRTIDGATVDTPFLLSTFLGARAFYLSTLGGVFSARLTVSGNLAESIAGEVRHEAVHYRWNALDEVVRGRLLAHSESLGVMDMQVSEYLAIVGDVTAAYSHTTTLRESYEELYQGHPAIADIMAQEAVAHMEELAAHGYLTAEALAPIAADMAVLSGQGVVDAEARPKMQEAAERGVTLPDGTKIKGVPLYAIRAFHGSPHDFDKFDLGKIGSGEGAQAYGHGLYFAESELVARSYRDALGNYDNAVKWKGSEAPTPEQKRIIDQLSGFDVGRNRQPDLSSVRTDITRAINQERMSEGMPGWDAERSARRVAELRKQLETLDGMKDLVEIQPPGRMYEVSIKANTEDFLDWDKPLSQQSEKVRVALAETIQPTVQKWERLRPSLDSIDPQYRQSAIDSLNKNIENARSGGMSTGEYLDVIAPNRDYREASRLLREAGIPGIRYLDQGSRGAGEGSRNYVVFDDSLVEIVAKDGKPITPEVMLAISDTNTGRSMRRDFDQLGYYSKALEAAKAIPQAKGTPEQMLAALKKAGVKDAEIEATNLAAFLEGKKSITRDEIVQHLAENRVALSESEYGNWQITRKREALDAARQPRDEAVAWLRQVYPESADADPVATLRRMAEGGNIGRFPNMRPTPPDMQAEAATRLRSLDDYHTAGINLGHELNNGQGRYQNHSLDPSNPTYRETVLHLSESQPSFEQFLKARQDAGMAYPDPSPEMLARYRAEYDAGGWRGAARGQQEAWRGAADSTFRSGHFSEPNIIGHMMTSLNKHEGKTVFTLDQIQSDWGQKLRDGGVRDEAKIAELKAKWENSQRLADEINEKYRAALPDDHRAKNYASDANDALSQLRVKGDPMGVEWAKHYNDARMYAAEYRTANSAASGNPLVNTTDQWTTTTLRRALRQAAEADAEFIAIPSGDTVLSYNPGDAAGMKGFYGALPNREAASQAYQNGVEGIVPKNLRKLLEKIDKDSAKPALIDKLETPSGMKGSGFTLFPITDKVKKSVMEEGQPLFALSGYRQGRNVTEPETLRFWQKPPRSGDVLMFHGTRKTFDKFDMSYSRDFGVHFGTAEQASERLVTADMEGARTIPVEITLKNAIVMRDPGFWGPEEIGAELRRLGYAISFDDSMTFAKLANNINAADAGHNVPATARAVKAANEAIAEKLNSLGIDGIWYRNRHEGSGWSLTVWNKGQVRSATSNDVLMAMRPSIANRPLPDGQRRVSTPGTAAPARSLSQLVGDLNQALGLTTRIGRLSPGLKAQASAAGGKLRGQYNTATDVTRLAIPLDIETLSHEGGHALEERFGVPLRVLMEANAKELEKLATPGNDQLSEGFAEFVRRYVTNPKMAEARAPKFFKAFERFVEQAEPALLKRMHEVTDGYQDWINAPSGGAVLSTIKSAKNEGLIADLSKNMRKNGFRNVAVEYFHAAYTAIIDGLHPVKRATDRLIEIANANLAVPLGSRSSVGVIAARDPYKLLRLARNAYQGGHVDLMRGVRDYHSHEHKGPSLHDAIGVAMGGFDNAQWSDENIKAFGAYLIARRMVAEWNRFKAGELEGMPDKLSQADHIQAQKDFEQQFPQFIDAAEMVYDYQRNLLRKAKDAGFVSEETYDDLIKRSDYVPAHRDMSEDAEETVSGPGAQVFGANKARLLKQFRGSTRDIINPLETIARTTYEWNFLIARNDAIKALDRLARAVGPGGGRIAERIPASQMSGTQVNAIEIVKRAGKQAGMDEADLLFMTQALEQQLGEDADTVIFTPGVITEGGEPIVYLWEGGKRVAIRLADGTFGKEMYEAFTGIGRENLGPIMEFAAKPSQWLRAGVTLDPAFVAANWLRDNPAAWINSTDHGAFLPRFDRSSKASLDALRAAFGAKVDDLDVLASSGGIVGGMGMEGMNASRVDRDIKALQKKGIRIRDALPHKKQFWELTGVTETGTRLSVFRAARERALADGLDEYEATIEAAYTANDLIDFGRHGSKMLAARRLVTFLNAFIQGTEKGIRTAVGGSEVRAAMQDVISPYVRQADGQVLTVLERKAVPVAAQFYAKMVLIGFVGYALTSLYKDDPDYEEIPEYFRNTHWLFKDPTGTWRRIPKPFELGAMSNIMERSFEAYYKGDTKAMKRLMSGLGDLVTPPHVVPGVQVAYELWANKSKFTGGPIVPDNQQKLPGELQFTAYTSEFSKWIAVQTGVSAAKLDHAIAGITGPLGKSLLDKSNVIMPPVGQFLKDRGMPTLGMPTTPRPEQRDVDRMFIRRFTVDPARSSQSKKEFWKEMSQTNGEMAVKAAGYKEFYDRAQFDEANETLKRMKEHERVYALIEGHGSTNDKRSHPMNRARDVLQVSNGIRRDLDTGKLKDDNGNAYSPSDRRVIQEIIENIQMREARNAQIALGLPGFTHLKILPVEPVIRELEAKVPSLAEELDFRMRRAKVKDFDDVREGYADLKARVLEPDYAELNPPSRKVGRRSP